MDKQITQITQFKSVIQEMESVFYFNTNCPVNVAKEALFECLKWIGQIEDAQKVTQEDKIKENPNPDIKPPEQSE